MDEASIGEVPVALEDDQVAPVSELEPSSLPTETPEAEAEEAVESTEQQLEPVENEGEPGTKPEIVESHGRESEGEDTEVCV
jgi:hypothetical protein